MVTGDSQEEVIIFRDKQTLHHNIYIIIFMVIVVVIIMTTLYTGQIFAGQDSLLDLGYNRNQSSSGNIDGASVFSVQIAKH